MNQITKGVEMETKIILSSGTQILQRRGPLLCPRNQVKKVFQEGEDTQLYQNGTGELKNDLRTIRFGSIRLMTFDKYLCSAVESVKT